MTLFSIYQSPEGPPLTRWQKIYGWTIIWSVFFVCLLVLIGGALIKRR